MSDSDSILEDGLKNFCQQLVYYSQLKKYRNFETGSTAEIEHNELSMHDYGLCTEKLDRDAMHYLIRCYAFPRGRRVPAGYNGDVIRIHTDGVHPGYAMLINENDNSELARYARPKSDVEFQHGPAHCYLKAAVNKRILDEISDASVIFNEISVYDNVDAIHCPYWPAEASEWITRPRRHCCPSKSVIKQVVRYGCDFVCVPHKHSNNVNEWRFSFSWAEFLIIRSWTSSQRIVYRALRLIYKMIGQVAGDGEDKSVLCTYYFKTIMLWASEERPVEFWGENSLVNSVQHLLTQMAEGLEAKICCNYFIPANNMIDQLEGVDVSKDIIALRKASHAVDVIASVLKSCADEEYYCHSKTFVTDQPTWLYNSLLILDYIYNDRENYKYLFTPNYFDELHNHFKYAMSHVYLALTNQAGLHKSIPVSISLDTNKYLLCQQQLFRSAANLCQSSERALVDLNFDEDLIHSSYLQYDADKAAKISTIIPGPSQANADEVCSTPNALSLIFTKLNKESNRKSLLYQRTRTGLFGSAATVSNMLRYQRNDLKSMSEGNLDNLQASRDVRVSFTVCNTNSRVITSNIQFYRHWPEHSPTVHISWFIAKTYLANLYYTARGDYKSALEVCTEIIAMYEQSRGNKRFADDGFLVELSTQWAGIYDGDIQALLGLGSLCAFVSKRASRSVYSGVRPVQFVLYLRRRCAIYEHNWMDVVQYSKEWMEDRQRVLDVVHSGRVLLQASLNILLANGYLNLTKSMIT